MSSIPFIYHSIPPEFMTDKFLEDPIMMKLIRYIFRRVRPFSHTEEIFNNRAKIHIDLGEWEFIFGREKAALECGCSEKQVRTRINKLRASSYLQEIQVHSSSKGHFSTVRASSSCQNRASSSTEKRASSFTVYRLVTTAFNKNKGQQLYQEKGQQLTEKRASSKGHKEERRKKYNKNHHHPDPSSSNAPTPDDDSRMMTDDDDSFRKLIENEESKDFKPKSQALTFSDYESHPPTPNSVNITYIVRPEDAKTEVVKGVFLDNKSLEECIKVKGSIEEVKRSMEAIQASPKRKSEIINWPHTLANWNVPKVNQQSPATPAADPQSPPANPELEEANMQYSRKLKQYCSDTLTQRRLGWEFNIITSTSPPRGYFSFSTGRDPLVISMWDPKFKDICHNILQTNNIETNADKTNEAYLNA